MAAITLKQGDFGGEATVTVGETALYLPDKSRPGLHEMTPLTAIVEIETLSDGRSGQLKHAARLGIRGLLTTGNPLGLAASVLAVTKVKDVEFSVRLKDGRSFVATADAATLANLRSACRLALVSPGEDAEAQARADAVIAKYLRPGVMLGPQPEEEAPVATLAPPLAAASAPAEAADGPAAAAAPAPPRRVFGRRGR